MTTTRNIIYKMLTQHLLPTMYVQQTNASIVDELRNIIHEHNAVMSNTAANGNIVQFKLAIIRIELRMVIINDIIG